MVKQVRIINSTFDPVPTGLDRQPADFFVDIHAPVGVLLGEGGDGSENEGFQDQQGGILDNLLVTGLDEQMMNDVVFFDAKKFPFNEGGKNSIARRI